MDVATARLATKEAVAIRIWLRSIQITMEATEITMEATHVRNSVETVRQNVTMMLLAVAKKSTALRTENVKTTVDFGLILLVVCLASPAKKHTVETEISMEATEITMEAALPCQATRIITTRTRLQTEIITEVMEITMEAHHP